MQNENFGIDVVNSSKTFANYQIFNENRAVCEAIRRILDSPLHARKQLFICGQSGLGKTHLAHAIVNEWQSRYPTKPLCYIDASILGSAASRHHSATRFESCLQILRTVPLLVIEYPHLLDKDFAGIASRQRRDPELKTLWFDTVDLRDQSVLQFDPNLIEQKFLQTWRAETSREFLRISAARLSINLAESLEEHILRESRLHPRRLESYLELLNLLRSSQRQTDVALSAMV